MNTEETNPLATQKVSSLILKFTIPAIIIFAFLQKYLISGLSAGAVKG